MSNPIKILVIVGTVREGRVGRSIADWYLGEARKTGIDAEFEILDAKDVAPDLFNEPVPPLYHQYSDKQEALAKKIGEADGYVIVTGEYNHSVPGSLKNLLDYVAAEWNHKAAAFVGYGGSGGLRSIEHLLQIFNFLGVAGINSHVTIHTIWEALDDKGVPKPSHLAGSVEDQLKELSWWVRALKNARG